MTGLIGLAALSADVTATMPLNTPSITTGTTITLAAGAVTRVDASAGTVAATLPAAKSVPAGGIVVAKKWDSGSNPVNLTPAGSDTINGTAGARSILLAKEAVHLRSDGVSDWTVVASDTPLSQLDARFLKQSDATGTYGQATVGNRLRRAATRAEARNSVDLGVMANPPTLTGSTSSLDAALSKSYRTSVDGLQWFRFTGGTPQTFAVYQVLAAVTRPAGSGGNVPGDATKDGYDWSVEFWTDSPRVQIRHLGAGNPIMVEVNDQPVQASPITLANSSGTVWNLLDFTLGSATITASGGVFTTSAAHGLAIGDQVILGAITTTTGVTANTTYYVKTVPSATTFTLSNTYLGTALTLTGDGSAANVSKAGARKFRIEYTSAGGFDGVYIHPQYTVWPPKTENGIKAVVVGDSIEASTGRTLPNGTWSKVAGKLLGWTDVRQVAFGGTGFSNAGTFNKFGAAQRITDAVNHNPDLLIIAATQNDEGFIGTTYAADMLSTLQAYRAALPKVPIVVIGPDAASTGPSGTRLSNEALALSTFTTWADGNSWFIPCSNAADGSWFTGTGTQSSQTGTGNRDRFGFDAAHPNDLGHAWRARRFVAAFRQIVLPNLP